MASLLRTCFQNEDPYTLAGCGRDRFPVAAIANYTTLSCARRSGAYNEDSSICCAVVCSQSAACFDLQRLLFYSPLHFFPLSFSLSFYCRYNLFFPKTCSRQLLALLMAVHWQLDSSSITDLYRRGKIDSGDRCGILFQVKGSRRRFCTVTRLAYTYGYILKTLMRFRLGDWS